MAALEYELCDFKRIEHRKAVCELLNHYMQDPMGDHAPHDESHQEMLLSALEDHPTAEVLLVKKDGDYIAMSTIFVNLSTFYIQPYMYIHDVVVRNDQRGLGIGKSMINKLIEISRERNYCKLTLEVREDNPGAQKVYSDLGFVECEPRMFFWTKYLN